MRQNYPMFSRPTIPTSFGAPEESVEEIAAHPSATPLANTDMQTGMDSEGGDGGVSPRLVPDSPLFSDVNFREKNVALALQRVFYRLQVSAQCIKMIQQMRFLEGAFAS